MAAPTEEELKVPELRTLFQTKYKETIDAGEAYEKEDVDRINTDDRYVLCFMRAFTENMDVEKPAENIDKVLKWRKELGILHFKEADLPQELAESNYMYWHGVDNKGQKILHLKVKEHKKGQHVDITKKHIAWMMDQHHQKTPGDPDRIVFIFDFTGAGVTNVDMDVVKFIISALSNYYPGLLAYILMYEMPWLLGAVWTVIQGLLSKEQKEKVKKVNKAAMSEYINEDQLEDHMKSNSKKK